MRIRTLQTAAGVAAGLALAAYGAGMWAANPAASAGEYRLFAPGTASDQQWAISEVADPDEARFSTNDLGRVRISASAATVQVRLGSADGTDLVPEPGSMVVQLFWYPDGEAEANYVQAIVGAERVDIIRLDTQFGGRLTYSSTAYEHRGDMIEFELPRSLFRRAETVRWVAFGYDPACAGSATECQDTVPHDEDNGPPDGTNRPEFRLP